jgi:hypothetical protein
MRVAFHQSKSASEDFMRKGIQIKTAFGILALFTVLVGLAVAAPEKTPANVAGTWDFKVSGDAGAADQVIVIAQDGDKLTGTFKGPRQSGSIAGTMDGTAIKFTVSARVTMNYTGTVEGETMHGTLFAQGKSGDWTAHRVKP